MVEETVEYLVQNADYRQVTGNFLTHIDMIWNQAMVGDREQSVSM